MRCNHKSCGNAEKVWLPYEYMGREQGLKPHLFCKDCGLLKNESSEKPRRIGYYINTIVDIGKEVKITKVQMRLICKELERQGIEDNYGMDKHMQENLFTDVVKRYVSVSDEAICRHLKSK